MIAAILREIDRPLAIEELLIPDLGIGQVLVRVYCSGICGAQLNEISGAKGEDKYLPHLLGHEGGGVVIKVGPGVTQVHEEDHVVMHWRKGRGIDAQPPKYKTKSGEVIGGGWITTFNTFAIISENRLTSIGKDIPFHIAALMGCAVTTALGLINNEAKLKIGQSITVAGCGGVGLNVIQGAVLAGAGDIVGVDINCDKLAMASKFGATHVTQDIHDIKSSDVFVDCTGNPDVIDWGFSHSKRTVLVGQPRIGKDLILSSMSKNYCGKTMLDSQGGMTDPSIDIPRYLNLYKTGKLELDSLITHRFPLEQVNDALAVVKSGNAGRCMLTMEEDG